MSEPSRPPGDHLSSALSPRDAGIVPSPADVRMSVPPAPLAPLVGRSAEISDVHALIDRPGVRLLSLTGPGGVGKTRLASAVVHERAQRCLADRIGFVELASVRHSGLVPATIAQGLGIPHPGQGDPLGAVGRYVGTKPFLLVLDNFEHVLDAAWIVADLLHACPGLKVVVTSRAVLHLYGEQCYPVRPLSLPDLGDRPQLAELARADSVRLFTVRAQAADPAFVLTEENASHVAAVCARLDGLPLAIELAAARISMFTPAALLSTLKRRAPMLTEGPRDLPLRLRTMHDCVAWSYDILDPGDQALFRRLAVFQGDITFAAAEAMERDSEHTLPRLTSLVAKNLLQARAERSETTRFTMLETVRDYGLEELERHGETVTARLCHAAWCLDEAERIEKGSRGAEQARFMEAFERSLDDFRAALEWATSHDPHLALRLVRALGRSWRLHGLVNEGRVWLERALDAGPGADPDIRAAALDRLGTLLLEAGEVDRAEARLLEGLALSESHGDPVGIADLRLRLAEIAYQRGDYKSALLAIEDALRVCRAHDAAHDVARALLWLGYFNVAIGERSGARRHFEESLEIHTRLGYTQRVARGQLSLAAVDELDGDIVMATTRARSALAAFLETKHVLGAAEAELLLGRLALVEGDVAQACQFASDALRRLRASGARPMVADALGFCGAIAVALDRPDAAVRVLTTASTMATGMWNRSGGPDKQALLHQMERACQMLKQDSAERIQVEASVADDHSVIEYALAFLNKAHTEAAVQAGSAVVCGKPTLPLTRREQEVLALLVHGMTDRQISETLFISRKTASDHVAHILTKLGAINRTGAVAVALREGLVKPSA